MKNKMLLQVVLVILFSIIFNSATAQNVSEKIKNEITETLNLWNTTAKESNTNKFMTLFDNSPDIILIGSDKGEIFKGKDQIKGWLSKLFENNSFSWEMDRIDIDCFGKTAWVFVEGSMIVSNKTGKTGKTPYRFTGIMIKKNNEWKWRLFNGSIPQGE